MHHRSSELQEHIEILGGNLVLFYQQRDAQPRDWKDLYDLDRFAIPDSPMSEREPEADMSLDQQDPSSVEASEHTSGYLDYLIQRPDARNPPVVQFSSNREGTVIGDDFDSEGEDQDEEEEVNEIPYDITLAETDGVVKKYAEKPDPPPHSFPASFLQCVPFAALKALYYMSRLHPDRAHIIELFNIPPAVQTVMAYARYENSFDGFDQSCWPSLDGLHPSIRKALYLGSATTTTTIND
jgi:hypothetical protein